MVDGSGQRKWTFLSDHFLVLFELARRGVDGDVRQRTLSWDIGISEPTVRRCLDDLEAAGYVTPVKVGRRKLYQVNLDGDVRGTESGQTVADLIAFLSD